MASEKVLDKVRKLLNLAKDGAATEGEVENALRFARKMMTEYGIEEADLILDDPGSIEVVDFTAVNKAELMSWEKRLSSVVMSICDVEAYIHKERRVKDERGHVVGHRRRPRHEIHFVGVKRDAAIATELYQVLVITIRTMANKTYSDNTERALYRSYCAGFVEGLRHKAAGMREEARQGRPGEIMLAKDAIVSKWLRESGLRLVPARRSRNAGVDGAAFGHGAADGRRASLATNSIKGRGSSWKPKPRGQLGEGRR